MRFVWILLLFAMPASAGVFRFKGHDPTKGDTSSTCSQHKYVALPTPGLTRHIVKVTLYPCTFHVDSSSTDTVTGAAFSDSIVTAGSAPCYTMTIVYHTRWGWNSSGPVLTQAPCTKTLLGLAK